ncbi:methionyl-tRNA formyltransferase [Candidatus Woesebacteria bacterium]|nr:methionyl-tRNA formyltransferase [Candidatus Woesebacteria bacterium]QQG47411.1 MAG: methionyl-tRNA formyltransferase [Candidatus Woesebacteria bacterium]
MKIIFFGTPTFVLPILEKLNKKYNWTNHKELVGVVTQPPRPDYSAVDKFAHNHKISIYYDPKEIEEADLGIVASYGKIIPESVIKNFRFGILNIHPSLLPKYRGASPIQYAIKEGEEKTGVTIIKMDEKMDHGPIVSQFTEEIQEDDTQETLRDRLFERASEFLIELIPNYINGKIKLEQQDDSKATFTKIITKKDGFLNPKDLLSKEKSQENFNLIRAMYPWPGVWTKVYLTPNSKTSKILKLLKSHLEKERLIIDEVQLEGKNKVTFKQFQEGHPNYKLA